MITNKFVICDSFLSVIGINEGYFHNNDTMLTPHPDVYADIQLIADEIYAETGKYVGVVVTPAKVVYKEEWGCPKGGEDVYVLTGNSFFESRQDETREAWKGAVELFILRLKEHFKQTTVQIEWSTKAVVRYDTKK
jgi:hypothetical protein